MTGDQGSSSAQQPAERVERSRLADPRAMSFGEHLEELRRRLIWALLGVAPIFIAAMLFGRTLLGFLLVPVLSALRAAKVPAEVIATGPLETFSSYLKVAAVVTIALGVPWILWQLWLFVSPGLYEHEKRFARFLVPFSLLLSISGLAFLYYVMMPAMLAFFISFASDMWDPSARTAPLPEGVSLTLKIPILETDPSVSEAGNIWISRDLEAVRIDITPAPTEAAPAPTRVLRSIPMRVSSGIAQQYRISEYVGLVFTMSIAFITGFQTPIVVLLLGWLGIFDLATMRRSRKYAFFFAFVVGAILTPSPDPFSMTLLAVPLYLLYELGLILLKHLPPERVARGLRSGPAVREPADAGDE
jgi:sec-independent protein translocase protein TatC